MKGDEKVIATLNSLLADELTATNQYMVHAEMCENWGYEKLQEAVEKRAITEMRHAEKLIARILFLEGLPIVSELNQMNIGAEVEAQLKSDWQAEHDAIQEYNADIRAAAEYGDSGTHELLKSILVQEEEHIDEIEAQLDQIKQMGIQNYLMEQIG